MTVAVAVPFLLTTAGARADDGPSIIRDAEIESILHSYSDPLFRAGGINPNLVTLRLLNEPTINSFVTTGNRMFIYTGLVLQAKTPNQLIGVIAHESGHVAGGHIIRLQPELEKASVLSLLSLAVGALAGVASGGRGDVAAGAMAAGQEATLKNFFSFSRSVEGSADAFAMKVLDASHQSARGLLEFFEYLEGQEALVTANQDPYIRTHPLTTERIDAVRNHVDSSPYSEVTDSPAAQARHDRMLAKLFGFLETTPRTLQRYPETDQSVPARYARSIAYFRIGEIDKSLPLINSLLKDSPNDPYFNELKGQMLFENGRLPEARVSYERAVHLAPNEQLIAISLAQVLVGIGKPDTFREAIPLLNEALAREHDNALGWRLLGSADAGLGDDAHATYALAEYAMLVGDYPQAAYQAKAALRQLPQKDPAWLRLQDISSEAERETDAMKQQHGDSQIQ